MPDMRALKTMARQSDRRQTFSHDGCSGQNFFVRLLHNFASFLNFNQLGIAMHNEVKNSIAAMKNELDKLGKYLISSDSKLDDSFPLSQEKHLDAVNQYLKLGNGRGRLQSEAAVYDGKVGYFFVSSIEYDGVKTDSIIFSTVDGATDICITAFPKIIKNS